MPAESAADRARPVLVIGGTGRIGRELVALLRGEGRAHCALARDSQRARAILGDAARIVTGDLDDAASLARAMKGVHAVYLATGVGVELVAQNARVIAAARSAGVAHIVRVSTEGVTADAPMRLAAWHREGEAALERSGIAWTHLRPCNFMHNMLTFAPGIAAQGELRAPFGVGRMALVDVGDIAAVARACLHDPALRNTALHVTGEEWLGYDELAAEIGRAIGREVRYVPLAPEEGRREMIATGYPPWLADDLLAMYAVLARDTAPPLSDVVRRVAGRAPRRFAAFASAHADTFATGRRAH